MPLFLSLLFLSSEKLPVDRFEFRNDSMIMGINMNSKLRFFGLCVILTAFSVAGFAQHRVGHSLKHTGIHPKAKTHSAKHTIRVAKPIPTMVTHNISVPPFNAIESRDHVDIKVIANQKSGKVIVVGSPGAVGHFHAVVRHHLLHLYFGSVELLKRALRHGKRRVFVEVYTRHLSSIHQGGICNISVIHLHHQRLSVKKSGSGALHISGRRINLTDLVNMGTGRITIKNIKSRHTTLVDSGSGPIFLKGKVGLRVLNAYGQSHITISGLNSSQLSIDSDTNGVINLKGVMMLSDLHFKGSGLLRIYWINSPQLVIRATGSGTIALAGKADLVDAALFHDVTLDMRYLRVKNVFVKTHQHAEAYVWASNNLFALADNGSDIYYFSKPNFLSMRMRQDGSVLNMEDVPTALLSFNPNH